MSQAIEFVHAHERDRLPELRAEFYETCEGLIEHLRHAGTPEAVFDMVAAYLHDQIPFDRLGLALLVDDGQVIASLRIHSRVPIRWGHHVRRALAGSSLEPLIRDGSVRLIHDLQEYLQLKPSSNSTRKLIDEGMRSSLTLPLYHHDMPLGFLFFTSMRSDTYHLRHVAMALQVAPSIGLALGRTIEMLDRSTLLGPRLPEPDPD
jgi:hypothetical protein